MQEPAPSEPVEEHKAPWDSGIMVNLGAGCLMYRGLPHATRVMTGSLDKVTWDPRDWSLADLCYLRVILVRALRKIENHLDEEDLRID